MGSADTTFSWFYYSQTSEQHSEPPFEQPSERTSEVSSYGGISVDEGNTKINIENDNVYEVSGGQVVEDEDRSVYQVWCSHLSLQF